jgi:hypothetical protein
MYLSTDGGRTRPGTRHRRKDRRAGGAPREWSAAHHQHVNGARANRGAERIRGRLHVGREHAGGRALEGPPRRSRDRDGARAVVGGRVPFGAGRGREARKLLVLTSAPHHTRPSVALSTLCQGPKHLGRVCPTGVPITRPAKRDRSWTSCRFSASSGDAAPVSQCRRWFLADVQPALPRDIVQPALSRSDSLGSLFGHRVDSCAA